MRIAQRRCLAARRTVRPDTEAECGSLSPEAARSRSCDDLAANAERGFDRVLAADLPRPATISSGDEMLLAHNGRADLNNGRRLPIWAA